MSDAPTYTFLPWSRLGIANSIEPADNDAAVKLRATVPVDLTLDTELVGGGAKDEIVHKDVQLYGPGDIVGIDPQAIVRTEPQHWITSFESNLLAYAEFHDPDFPWRYTPAASTPTRLRPWLAVVVLAEDEFEDVHAVGRPLAAFSIATGKQAVDLFPAADQLWAWAHVHASRSLDGTDLDTVLREDPDVVTSRVLCPRRLAANKTYHAFLIPTFETGRLAGLGAEVPADTVATRSAWADGQSEFPYYHRWRFRTGFGDFEYLVRLLRAQPCDKRVGVRDIDVLHPGSGLSPIDQPLAIQGVLKLGGALQVPRVDLTDADRAEIAKFEEWDHPIPHRFQQEVARLVNLGDDYTTAGVESDDDPVVTLPLYGRWHALTSRLLERADQTPVDDPTNWVHDLNLDPRWRVAAGLGTRIVQQHQESYVDAAWQQVGDVLAANRSLALAQLGRHAAAALYRKHIAPLEPARRMLVTSPVHGRITTANGTVRHVVERSSMPRAAITSGFRAVLRSRGRIATRTRARAPGTSARIVDRIATGELITLRPWGAVNGLTVGKLGLSEADRTPAAVARMPKRPSFIATRSRTRAATPGGTADSAEAMRFKQALGDAYALTSQPVAAPVRAPLAMASVASQVVAAVDPDHTVPSRHLAAVRIPARIASVQVEPFVPAMVYPELDAPMYKPLADLSSELFLPNINLITNNSVTLLETNQPFIESYMVGLNHEMARELLWREYPTDQRGSVFRQFWDVSAVEPQPPPADVREHLRDIPPIHKWGTGSNLGDHNQREHQGDAAQLVLVVRGELLKRYPNTVIYAMKAEWALDRQGKIDKTKERIVVPLDDAELEHPPWAKVRTPLYEARVKPDIFFIGFDLTAAEARGTTADAPDNPGWFFVLQERPGEPRFGVDLPAAPGGEPTRLVNWSSLDWSDVGTAEGACITLDKTILLVPPNADDQENQPITEDQAAHWNPETSAAELAYILYQVPVMIAVHAHRMLP